MYTFKHISLIYKDTQSLIYKDTQSLIYKDALKNLSIIANINHTFKLIK